MEYIIMTSVHHIFFSQKPHRGEIVSNRKSFKYYKSLMVLSRCSSLQQFFKKKKNINHNNNNYITNFFINFHQK